ncbi:pilus assembly protein PilP [Geomonas ferrireducens]|uniref:pilus assembly protein PilP n=1 Tax=Geomonas ferrireducens TaxID=2570227 RepID=UPI001FE53286|nr:pilus assembly protein PilP [Geomonas ferrireducens]
MLLLALALVSGCKNEEAPAPAPAPKPVQPAQPAPAPKPAPPVQQQLSSVAKSPGALSFKKDPFKPVIVPATPAPASSAAGPSVSPAADLLPIQSFEVSKFKVAGIIAGIRENRALLIDPNGKGYVVQVGMQVGNANGRVTKITPSTVQVVEKGTGRGKGRTIVLTLAKKR